MNKVNASFSTLPPNCATRWQEMHRGKCERGVLRRFADDKLGMFVHWGLYSIPSGMWGGKEIAGLGEWIMYHAEVSRKDYAGLARQLDPVAFDAAEWVGLAKRAGMRYLVVTAKHHDGFALWQSAASEFNLLDATSAKIHLLDELHAECRRQGIGFGLYYSHVIDWKDGWEGEGGYPGDPARRDREKGNPMNTWDPPRVARQDYFENKAYPQLQELLVRYPGLYSIWFDYWYEGKYLNPAEAFRFYELVYRLQPDCLVNSRVDGRRDGATLGDYISADDNAILSAGQPRPWECPATVNNTWGFSARDHDWKSGRELIYLLVSIVSRGGNYLLNIGPKPDGSLPDGTLTAFRQLGDWMAINGEAIHGTRMWQVDKEGPLVIRAEGTDAREDEGFQAEFSAADIWFTCKAADEEGRQTVYAIGLVRPADGRVLIRSLAGRPVESVAQLGSDAVLAWRESGEGLAVDLAPVDRDAIGYVLRIVV